MEEPSPSTSALRILQVAQGSLYGNAYCLHFRENNKEGGWVDILEATLKSVIEHIKDPGLLMECKH